MRREARGETQSYLLIKDAPGLVAATQIDSLELHIWGSRVDRLERPERIVFDLDPDPTIDFECVIEAAFEIRRELMELGLASFPLLTGGKGIHVVAPIQRRRDWPEVKAFCKGLAYHMANKYPEIYVATASKAKRKGRIFIDWLRNERGATAIAPYSLRAHAGAPVAAPVSWEELPGISSSAQFSVMDMDARLKSADPWLGYGGLRQSITARALRQMNRGL